MSTPTYWILRHENRLLLADGGEAAALFPMAGECPASGLAASVVDVGTWLGCACKAADLDALPEASVLANFRSASLRDVFLAAGAEAFALAGRAVQLLDWAQQHRYCGRCGTPTVPGADAAARACPQCGLQAYPRISPAVMVLVRKGSALLLARSPRFKAGVYSALAGFVEAGETLEACVAREVREEVGIEVRNLRYFGSQSWPFPNSLMIAFTAEYAGGELAPDGVEIEDAAWFEADNLPLLPDPISISRVLIDAAIAGV